MIKTINLTANVEQSIDIVGNGRYVKIKNLGDSTIYISRKSNIVAKADGVISIQSGEIELLEDAVSHDIRNCKSAYYGTIYALSDTDTEIEVSTTSNPNFKGSVKGGEIVALKQQIALLNQQVNDLMSSGMKREIVDTLPTDDIDENTIYMVPKTTAQEGNYYNEFVYTSQGWELIGDAQIDLADYYTKSEVDSGFLPLAGGTITGNLSAKSDILLGANGISLNTTLATKINANVVGTTASDCNFKIAGDGTGNLKRVPIMIQTSEQYGLTGLIMIVINRADGNVISYRFTEFGTLTVGKMCSTKNNDNSTNYSIQFNNINNNSVWANVMIICPYSDVTITASSKSVLDAGTQLSKFVPYVPSAGGTIAGNLYAKSDILLGANGTSLTTAINSLATRLSALDSGAGTVV